MRWRKWLSWRKTCMIQTSNQIKYSTIIKGYGMSGEFDLAYSVLKEMESLSF